MVQRLPFAQPTAVQITIMWITLIIHLLSARLTVCRNGPILITPSLKAPLTPPQGRTPVVARQGVKSPCSLPPKTLLEPHRTSDQAEARNPGYTSSYRLPRLLAIVDSIDAARPLS